MDNNIAQLLETIGLSPSGLLQLLFSLMISVLFIQSGLDKVINWKGESGFYKEHFKNSILKGTVSLLMPIITLSELAAGFLSAAGIFVMLFTGDTTLAFLGMLMACLSILQLFFGQRVAKDYAGAATLVPYFLMAAAGLYVYMV
jgi:hypothetical protein